MQRVFVAVCLLAVASCTARADASGTPLPALQTAFYRTAFADAETFVSKSIPTAMLTPSDRGNATYLEVYNRRGSLLGYLRDFSGPVSPAEACACNPLTLTLVFNPDRSLRSFISTAPLQKYGHAPMSPAEQQQLLDILKNPPPALMAVRRVEDMVDVTTGATKQALKGVVVPEAALSTRRLAEVVRDTQNILRGAPAGRDWERLHAIVDKMDKPVAQARELAALLPSLEMADTRRQAYYLLIDAYISALGQGADANPSVENVLLQPSLPPETQGADVAYACYRLADKGLRLDFVRKCAAALSAPRGFSVPPGVLAKLRGIERLAAGDPQGALPQLREAVRLNPQNAEAELRLRLAQAYQTTGQADSACAIARALWPQHPLMPNLDTVLQSCAGPGQPVSAVIAELTRVARQEFLRQMHPGGVAVPVLSVENMDGQPQDVALHEAGKITVVVFFATWCPHCRAELPRVKAFVDLVNSKPQWKDRVRVIGVRTAVEKEVESYPVFKRALAPNFPVYTDPTMALAFSHFAKVTGVPAGLPTTAVVDSKGQARLFLEPGDYRDTKSELTWAVESLLSASESK